MLFIPKIINILLINKLVIKPVKAAKKPIKEVRLSIKEEIKIQKLAVYCFLMKN